MQFLMPGGHAYKEPRLLRWKNLLFMRLLNVALRVIS